MGSNWFIYMIQNNIRLWVTGRRKGSQHFTYSPDPKLAYKFRTLSELENDIALVCMDDPHMHDVLERITEIEFKEYLDGEYNKEKFNEL